MDTNEIKIDAAFQEWMSERITSEELVDKLRHCMDVNLFVQATDHIQFLEDAARRYVELVNLIGESNEQTQEEAIP